MMDPLGAISNSSGLCVDLGERGIGRDRRAKAGVYTREQQAAVQQGSSSCIGGGEQRPPTSSNSSGGRA
ncbi:hypothetical protein CDL15_Pgr024870 [Punica granatum]|uniref:Uncharacterized protein n=1 Tax=Punica granatum TaxID=22663 RepID=A0A218Y3V4_PUNGR|nr:hypothetical protein CDL15_Pgr024870 [Punica granatum]